MPATLSNRRQHERMDVAPMYSHVAVLVDRREDRLLGHSYDVSEGGLQIELDEAIEPGTQVSLEVVLPYTGALRLADDDRVVRARGTVVWVDSEEPGPVRLAVAFSRFASTLDKARLVEQLVCRRMLRAA